VGGGAGAGEGIGGGAEGWFALPAIARSARWAASGAGVQKRGPPFSAEAPAADSGPMTAQRSAPTSNSATRRPPTALSPTQTSTAHRSQAEGLHTAEGAQRGAGGHVPRRHRRRRRGQGCRQRAAPEKAKGGQRGRRGARGRGRGRRALAGGRGGGGGGGAARVGGGRGVLHGGIVPAGAATGALWRAAAAASAPAGRGAAWGCGARWQRRRALLRRVRRPAGGRGGGGGAAAARGGGPAGPQRRGRRKGHWRRPLGPRRRRVLGV
jgi:hypothetical protein